MITLLLEDEEDPEEKYQKLLRGYRRNNYMTVVTNELLYARIQCGIAEGDIKPEDIIAKHDSIPDIITFNNRAEPSQWPKYKDNLTDLFDLTFSYCKRLARALRKIDDKPVHKEVGIVRIAKSVKVKEKL